MSGVLRIDPGTDAGRKVWELETDVMLGRLAVPQVMERVRELLHCAFADRRVTRSEIERLEREIGDLQADGYDKDDEIGRLEDKIERLEQEVARLRHALAEGKA